MVNAKRRLASVAALAVITGLASGCVQIAAHLLAAYLSDPRTRNHAYNLKVEIAFRMKGQEVKAVRYAEVGYLTGKGDTSYWPQCDRSIRKCWYITNHYFVGLPNGDIMDVFLDSQTFAFDRPPDTPIAGTARLNGILRDQPAPPNADSQGTCRHLPVEVVEREYGYPVKDRYGSDVAYEITLTRVPEREARVIDPEDISMAAIIDEVSCKRLHARLSGGVTITPAKS